MHTFLSQLRADFQRALRQWPLALLLAVLIVLLAGEGPPPGQLEIQTRRLLAGEQFDFIGWEGEAVLGKLAHSLIAPQRYMDESARSAFFLDYLSLVGEIQHTERQISSIYADPGTADPVVAAAELRARLADLRAAAATRQPLAEAILEEQTMCVLSAAGFGALGQQFPPVSIHITPLPTLLIVSPRDHIEMIFNLGLAHGLDAARREEIEAQVDAAHNVSTLITDIGGLAAYPTMVLESDSLLWLTDVAAHEWTHLYLDRYPLGWSYGDSPEARTINETVASIVGAEVGRMTIARYYPDLLPPPPPRTPEGPPQPAKDSPAAFDFRAEMRRTRIRVDELLAEGRIEEAEDYMEERRQEFVAQGYILRKLNQAYFAFHGAYADAPGAAGRDPVGPAVRRLRALSPDIRTFVARIARVTTLAELQGLIEEENGR